MKLWKVTHLHPRAQPGATVHLLPQADEPTAAEAVMALSLHPAHGESIRIEDTGYQVAPFYTDLLAAARQVLGLVEKGDVAATMRAIAKLDQAAQDAAKVRPRSLIFVSGGVVTDVFSTERTMDVSIFDAQDMHSLDSTLQTVDEAVNAGTAGLYRLL